MASVTSTKRISSASGTTKHVRGYSAASQAGSFVEAIDTSNRIAVQANLDDEKRKKNEQETEQMEEKELSSGGAYVKSALEALAASGVYDDMETEEHMVSKVGVYGTNQTIINKQEDNDVYDDNVEESFFDSDSNDEVDEFI